MDDSISRRAAIDAADEECCEFRGIFARIKERINAIPSAQPERKTGRWIDYTEDGYVECPFCHSATNCDDNVDDLHYCFSCGAKMEVVK